MSRATGLPRGLILLAIAGCNTSPDIVSFNTPELCEPEVTNIATFTQAREECDNACQICIATTYAERAVTYAIARQDNCVCPAPIAIVNTPADAGLDAAAADAEQVPSDAGQAAPQVPNVASDGCSSLLNQTQSGAAAFCDDQTDCHVCVERVNFDNEPRRYMAHMCDCPSPYRLE